MPQCWNCQGFCYASHLVTLFFSSTADSGVYSDTISRQKQRLSKINFGILESKHSLLQHRMHRGIVPPSMHAVCRLTPS